MRQRCENARSSGFSKYGGRGITVCERWRIFENFLADMGEAPDGLSIDRIDSSRGYEPGNCRWATSREQSLNRRNVKQATFAGETVSLSELAERAGISRRTVYQRVKRYGWSIEDALSTPVVSGGTKRRHNEPR